MPIYFGNDVSRFQGVITWSSVAASKDFTIIKCGGGDSGIYTDSKYLTNRDGARATSLKRGYYWFGSLGLNDPVGEATEFVNRLGILQAGEVLALDAESEASAGIVLNQTAVLWCKAFLDTVAAAVGFNPFIYMSQSPSHTLDWSAVAAANYPLWVADYGPAPTGTNLYVGAWSDQGKGYPIHQYSSSGSVSGISGAVDEDAFFVPAGGTLAAWDGYGLGGTTPGGTPPVIQAGVNHTATGTTNSSYSQAQPTSLYAPINKYDQVIYSVVTTDATLATGSHNGFYEIPTTINQYAYPFGIFSYDGGLTYNDFGFKLPAASTYASVQPGVTIQPSVDASGNIFFNGVNNTAGTVNLILKIGLLASATPGPVKLPLVLTNTSSYTTDAKPIPSPTFQSQFLPPYSVYRRIHADADAGTGDQTVAHGLSTIPNFMVWVKTGGFVTINGVGWGSGGSLGIIGAYADGTNLHFHADGGTYTNVYYRTYFDN